MPAGGGAWRGQRRAGLAIWLAIVLGSSAGAGLADEPADACAVGPDVTRAVVAVRDGDTVELDDRTVVRLAGIVAPYPPEGGEAQDWPPALQARELLAELVLGRSAGIAYVAGQPDRYGRRLADLVIGDEGAKRSLATVLVEAGHARVDPMRGWQDAPARRACLVHLIVLEAQARKAGRGLWRHAAYQIRPAARSRELARFEQRFEIVEGVIREISTRGRRIYLNFGQNWRTDFTVSISARDRKAIERSGLDLAGLKRRRIRVRGFVESRNGPLIRVMVPEQIEVLEAATTPAGKAAGSATRPGGGGEGETTPKERAP
ncbi:MAG: thermonuclease family protein [Hyphomicrobiaceae bacterium]